MLQMSTISFDIWVGNLQAERFGEMTCYMELTAQSDAFGVQADRSGQLAKKTIRSVMEDSMPSCIAQEEPQT